MNFPELINHSSNLISIANKPPTPEVVLPAKLVPRQWVSYRKAPYRMASASVQCVWLGEPWSWTCRPSTCYACRQSQCFKVWAFISEDLDLRRTYGNYLAPQVWLPMYSMALRIERERCPVNVWVRIWQRLKHQKQVINSQPLSLVCLCLHSIQRCQPSWPSPHRQTHLPLSSPQPSQAQQLTEKLSARRPSHWMETKVALW